MKPCEGDREGRDSLDQCYFLSVSQRLYPFKEMVGLTGVRVDEVRCSGQREE